MNFKIKGAYAPKSQNITPITLVLQCVDFSVFFCTQKTSKMNGSVGTPTPKL
jgi:hypothetical protein